MADEEILVEIEKETPEGETPKTEAADPVADLKAQVEALDADAKREREEKERERTRAETERQGRMRAEQERDAGRTEVAESRLGTVEQGINAAQTASDAAQAEYETALESGDWKKASAAQIKIADARAHLVRLNEAKSDLEVEKTAPRVQRTEPTRTVPSDPVEAFLERCTAPTAKWLRAHPDEAKALALNDVRRGAKLSAAHSDALAEGLSADTPEYFGHVEKFLGMTKPNGGNGHDAAQGQQYSAARLPFPLLRFRHQRVEQVEAWK